MSILLNKNYPQNKLIVILGPTATGKSSLAIRIAKRFKGEIVSADSRQIYQDMDIGTAKIKQSEMQGIPHYLIDILNPSQNFTLAEYQKKAIKSIKQIQQKNKLPFLVGGTGLYIQSVVDNLSIPQVKPDKKLRAQLEKNSQQELVEQLKKLDPQALKIISPNNKQRLIRALEVCLKTKQPFSKQRQKKQPLFNALQIGLSPNYQKLDKQIEERTQKMINQGLIQEVKKLLEKYPANLPAFKSIGYQEIIQYLNGQIDLEETKQLITLHTRQYARRQMTWFKRDKKSNWIDNQTKAENLIKKFLEK